MREKAIIIYKGDQLTAYFYIGLSVFLGISAGFLFGFTQKIGWYFLAIGLSLLALFSVGKAVYIYFKAKNKLEYITSLPILEKQVLQQEIKENENRLQKKANNRRKYLYTLLFGFALLIFGILAGEKGLSIGSWVPVILFAGIEFCVSLLSEFRLWEYQRQLEKSKQEENK